MVRALQHAPPPPRPPTAGIPAAATERTDEEIRGADGEDTQHDVGRRDILLVPCRRAGRHLPPRVGGQRAVAGDVVDEQDGREQPRGEVVTAPRRQTQPLPGHQVNPPHRRTGHARVTGRGRVTGAHLPRQRYQRHLYTAGRTVSTGAFVYDLLPVADGWQLAGLPLNVIVKFADFSATDNATSASPTQRT